MGEYIYILSNEAFPDLFKIGKTKNIEDRVRQLSSHSGVPISFEVYYACEVIDSAKVEKSLHDAFADYRINPRREFFKINPERVLPILKLVELRELEPSPESYTDKEDIEIIEMAKSKRPNFSFKKVNLSSGDTISFIRDENITATVIDDKTIEYDGTNMSLSRATLHIMNSIYSKNWKQVQGPAYWTYAGEILTERRIRLEESEFGSSNRNRYVKYIHDKLDKEASGAPSSNIQAIEYLGELLKIDDKGHSECLNIWEVQSPDSILALRNTVSEEQAKFPNTIWNNEAVAHSYLSKGFMKSALTHYAEMLDDDS
jgi:hypothetical protein